MEDSHIAAVNLDTNVHFFGVFDGHGGKILFDHKNLIIMILIGREVALYVKDRYIDELKKLQSFKNKDYYNALRESFIKIDDLLKSPQGIKDIKKYSAHDES